MILKITCDINVTFFRKYSDENIIVDKVIKQEYDTDGAEFGNLCRELQVDMAEYDSEQEFLKDAAKMASDRVREEWEGRIKSIVEAFRNTYLNKTSGAYVELAGYVLNPADFSAVAVRRFSVDVSLK